jgi:hypothetical protein
MRHNVGERKWWPLVAGLHGTSTLVHAMWASVTEDTHTVADSCERRTLPFVLPPLPHGKPPSGRGIAAEGSPQRIVCGSEGQA